MDGCWSVVIVDDDDNDDNNDDNCDDVIATFAKVAKIGTSSVVNQK